MPKLADLRETTNATSVKIGKATVKLTYYVLYHAQQSEEEREEEASLTGREYLLSLIPHMLASWDVEGEDGHIVPLTKEGIEAANVPTALLDRCAMAVMEAETQGKAKSGT